MTGLHPYDFTERVKVHSSENREPVFRTVRETLSAGRSNRYRLKAYFRPYGRCVSFGVQDIVPA